jgi:HlyD family secretion protein
MFSKILRYGTIVASLAGIYLMIQALQAQADNQPILGGDPPVMPPEKPYKQSVAATGILEALSENVSIGVPLPGLITEVFVKVSESVSKGQALMKLDDRDLQADLLSNQAQQEISQAQVVVSEAQLKKLQLQLARLSAVSDSRAVSQDELENRKQDVLIAEAQLTAAKAQLKANQTEKKRIKLLIERLTVRAPRDGTLIQINVRSGEYAAATPEQAALILGDINQLQVRADIDEQNATRIRAGQAAYGYLKGDPNVTFPLKFVRIEPYVIPKISLTGSSTERVDTRVLQVIYSVQAASESPLYVGQQVEIFIDAPERTKKP